MSVLVLGSNWDPGSSFERESLNFTCAAPTCFLLMTSLQKREIKDGKEHKIVCEMLHVSHSCIDLEMHLFLLIRLVTEIRCLLCSMKQSLSYPPRWSYHFSWSRRHIPVWWSGSLLALPVGILLFDFSLKYLYCLIFPKCSFMLSHEMLSANHANSVLLW